MTVTNFPASRLRGHSPAALAITRTRHAFFLAITRTRNAFFLAMTRKALFPSTAAARTLTGPSRAGSLTPARRDSGAQGLVPEETAVLQGPYTPGRRQGPRGHAWPETRFHATRTAWTAWPPPSRMRLRRPPWPPSPAHAHVPAWLQMSRRPQLGGVLW
jgi:hypothetical protein